MSERLDLLDAAIYGDLFECAVTLDELWRYSRVRVTREDLAKRLAEPVMQKVIAPHEGLYCLLGREHLARLRASRQRRARALRRRAIRVVRLLRHAPFVRGVLLTGSVAADSAHADADVDLLVIVADRRISSVFAMLGSLSRLLSRRAFCPNYYLSEAHLTLQRRDHYVAREVVQSEALAGKAADLFAANPWVNEHLPNASFSALPAPPPLSGSLLQRWLETPLRGRFGDWVEGKARALALARLAAHHRSENRAVPEEVEGQLQAGVELRFHASPFVRELLDRYEARRAEIAEVLERSLEDDASVHEPRVQPT